ncbi:iron-siderophore ABC transporter substrate-binding protein [Natronosporangium hydrolyticum]|uniref:Iron-siderophore ABC transporter substrate-binding protein n=1 Tax=Natronosporangium hydrolyticum TaxID=2811111 RepID=A0A895YGY6_9ACTN|nr:iron-siderophore ABC transporter substrate-binding protein [Natronosporangium hydrolyticum]QSB14653.1 iron-siderophore ABC transporter substrate-binding protein [Natronosporangium hydrolyticum]
MNQAAPTRAARHRLRWLAPLTGTALLATVACGDDSTEPDAESGAETRVISHELGETEVPAAPERVVALDPYASLPTALAADATVVGTSYQPFGDPFPPYIDETVAGDATDVGWFTELNVEQIATLEPDVIIGLISFVEPYHDQLSEIAPTIALPLDDMVWQETVTTVAAAVGGAEPVGAELAAYQEQVDDLAAQLSDAGIDQETVSLLNIRALDDLRVYTRSCAAAVLHDLGIEPHLHDETEDGENAVRLSVERLTDADADHLFYFVGSTGTNPEDAQSTFDQVAENPLWEQLDAVTAGNAYPVDPRWWFNCGSLAAAELILDDVAEALLHGQAPAA